MRWTLISITLAGALIGFIELLRFHEKPPESVAAPFAEVTVSPSFAPGTRSTSLGSRARVTPEKSTLVLPELWNDSDDSSTAPTLERVRSEVEADPHSTPASVLVFAQRISTFMEVARASSEAARLAAPQLERCASADGKSLVESARVLCLISLQRLARANPDLENDYVATRESVEPRVAQLARAALSLEH
jgi:hypothetical protein